MLKCLERSTHEDDGRNDTMSAAFKQLLIQETHRPHMWDNKKYHEKQHAVLIISARNCCEDNYERVEDYRENFSSLSDRAKEGALTHCYSSAAISADSINILNYLVVVSIKDLGACELWGAAAVAAMNSKVPIHCFV